jgi:hypothetical protein
VRTDPGDCDRLGLLFVTNEPDDFVKRESNYDFDCFSIRTMEKAGKNQRKTI